MGTDITYNYTMIEYSDGWFRVVIKNEISGDEYVSEKMNKIDALNYLSTVMGGPEFVFEKTMEIAV